MKFILILILTLSLCKASDEFYYFSSIKIENAKVIAWIKSGPENQFTRIPVFLSENKEFEEKIDSAKSIAIYGKYFSISEILREVKDAKFKNNFIPLMGWTEIIVNTPNSPEFLEGLISLINENKDDVSNFLLCYSIHSLIDGLNFHPRWSIPFSDDQLKSSRKALSELNIKVDSYKFVDLDYRTYLIKRIDNFFEKKTSPSE